MIEIINRQRKIKIAVGDLRKFAAQAAVEIKEIGEKFFTVGLISDAQMRELNKNFRGKSSTTDVLSFPFDEENSANLTDASDNVEIKEIEKNNSMRRKEIFDQAEIYDESKNFLGDIVISVEQAARQALENSLELDLEIKQLILHGILHLCGFDHETDGGEMNRLELKYRRQLKINF